jgi:hypothetical protein
MENFEPSDLMVLLRYVDVNGLSDAEGRELSGVDIDDDGQLEGMMKNWIRPRYLEWDDQNRAEMQQILEQAGHWDRKKLRAVFDEIQLPSGQKINDIDRFLKMLRIAIAE